MSDNCREILRNVLALVAVVAVGVMVSWIVLRLQKPEKPVDPFEQVLPVRS